MASPVIAALADLTREKCESVQGVGDPEGRRVQKSSLFIDMHPVLQKGESLTLGDMHISLAKEALLPQE